AGTELKFLVPEAWSHFSAGQITVNFSYSNPSYLSNDSKATSTDYFTPTFPRVTSLSPSDGGVQTPPDLDALDLRYASKTGVYTKTESDAKYALQTALPNYALKTEIPRLQVPDLSGYHTKIESDERYAKKTDLEGIDIKPLQEELEELDIKSMREALINLSNKLSDLNRKVGTVTGELVQSVRLEQAISVKPNPASDYLEIQTPEETHLKIIDPTGKVLRAKQIVRGVHRISIQELPAGSYLLILQIGAQATSYTFIKG
ncbi:MAG: T9SS type A sorting domain-containing protein, partial [Cytophagales bacterium]|nr:T9SS type A sorting domain-containing protein [Cytophagales bacterium]